MPSLKQLTCSLMVPGSAAPLQEFRTAYADGHVETFIAVPDSPKSFFIRLTSNGYIARGLSMFIYIDGVYQCNRNRQNLDIAEQRTSRTDRNGIDFRVSQKERVLSDGTFAARPWTFAQVHTNSSSIDDGRKSAPHNGEYVGTIEVVVLRCQPPDLTTHPITPPAKPVNGAAPVLGVKARIAPVVDPSRAVTPQTPKPNQKAQPKSKPKRRSKPLTKGQYLGLDGAWDEPGPSNPPDEGKKVEVDPWDNWAIPSLTTENPPATSWDNSRDPPAKETSKSGGIEMTNAGEGLYQPVTASQKAASNAGSQRGNQKASSRANSQAGSTKKSQQGRSQLDPFDKSSQQAADAVNLRGGGSETQSIRSHHSAKRSSPMVVNNSIVYNGVGTPPPMSAGPPQARDFWKRMEGNSLMDNLAKAAQKPTTPAPDPWDNAPLPEPVPSPKEKVDDWNAGETNMPGAWDNDSGGWPNADSGPAKESSQNNDPFVNNDNDFDWNKPVDDTTKQDDGWGGLGNVGVENNDDWGNSDNKVDQPNTDWSNSDVNNDTHADNWDSNTAQEPQQNDTWGAEDVNTAPIVPEEPQQASPKKGKKGKKQKQKQNPTPPKEHNAEPRTQQGAVAPKSILKKPPAKKSIFDWFGRASAEEPAKISSPAGSRKASTPGAWSPPMKKRSREPSPEATHHRISEVDAEDHSKAHSELFMSSEPTRKPYWSTWRDSETRREWLTDADLTTPIETPLYHIPQNVAKRQHLSHQVRPGLPRRYSHKTSRPTYMDSHEHPYAVFVFHYRSKDIIEEMLNAPIPDSENEEKEKQRLSSLPKAQLVEELIKAKDQGNWSGSKHSSDKATYRSNPNGVPVAPNVSALTEELGKLASSKAPTPEKVGGWLEGAGGDGNGNGHEAGAKKDSDEHKKDDDDGFWGAWDGNGNGNGDTWGGEGADKKAEENNTNATAWDNHGDVAAADDDNKDTSGDAWDTNKDTTKDDAREKDDKNEAWDANPTKAEAWNNDTKNEAWDAHPINNNDDDDAAKTSEEKTGDDEWGNWDFGDDTTNANNDDDGAPKESDKPVVNNGDEWGIWDNNDDNTGKGKEGDSGNGDRGTKVDDWGGGGDGGGGGGEDKEAKGEKEDDAWGGSGFGFGGMDTAW